MSEALKPVHCGCGGEAKVIMIIPEVYAVECTKCWIRTCSPARTEAEAVEAWNRAMSGSAEAKLKAFWDGMSAEMKEERTAKVEVVEKPNVYKCCECGQYFHSTSWGSPVLYCSRCGARLEWE